MVKQLFVTNIISILSKAVIDRCKLQKNYFFQNITITIALLEVNLSVFF